MPIPRCGKVWLPHEWRMVCSTCQLRTSFQALEAVTLGPVVVLVVLVMLVVMLVVVVVVLVMVVVQVEELVRGVKQSAWKAELRLACGRQNLTYSRCF